MASATVTEAGRKARNYGSLDAVDNGEMPDEQEPCLKKGSPSLRSKGGTPEYYRSASLWSRLVFGWLDDLLALGNDVGRLDPEDLAKMPLLPGDGAEFVSAKFERYWEEEKSHVGAGCSDGAPKEGGGRKTPSLARALFRAFGWEFVLAGALKFTHDLLQFVGPNVLNRLIKFLRNEDSSLIEGCYLTAAVVLAQILMSFCLRHYFFQCYRTGLRVRTACIVAIYKKALAISSFERQTRTVGEITNLMSIDSQRLQDTTTFFHAVWYSAVQIVLALFFLWQQLGPSCLAGVAVIMVSMPLTANVAAMMGRLQKAVMKSRDERVDVNNEVLSSMKVIKLQAWEKSFQDRIEKLREKELNQLLRYLLGRCCNFMLWSSVPLLVALSTFAAYAISGHDLDVAEALTALVLFDILRFPLFMLPNVINTLVEANIALGRILSFLLASEHKPVTAGGLEDVGVQFHNATFVYDSKRPKTPPLKGGKENKALAKELSDKKWELQLLRAQLACAERKIQELSEVESDKLMDQSSNLLSLYRVDLSLQAPELIAVVGAVGSGKSTLINSILGEVRALAGAVHAKGSIAFYSQSAYMVNDTVRGNIIFGNDPSEMNVSRYQAAVDSCALQRDFSLLPSGDSTIIGERGITLSGGQKARIQLARCVYSDADIYLLDDPLAAVDAHVGKHIFERCIVDELLLQKGSIWRRASNSPKKRLIVLATNTLQFLKHREVARIVVLKDGCIDQVGTYSELCEHGTFRSFLESFHETLGCSNAKEEIEDVNDGKQEEDEISPVPTPSPSFLKSLGTSHRRKSRRSSVPVTLGQVLPQRKARRAQSLKLALASLPAADRSSPLIAAEERAMGHVSREVYIEWARASGGIPIALFIIFSYLAVEGVNVLSQWYLTYWSEHGSDIGQLRALAIYAGINFTAIIAMFCRMLLVMLCGIRGARMLFSEALRTVLGVPMSFFDTTPLGRVVNIFSKDMYTIDEVLPSSLQMYLDTVASVAGVLVVISTVTPLFVLFLLPIIIFYSRQQSFFTQTYRELKRLDSTSRSPIYALFSESLDGVATIRAFNIQTYLNRNIISLLDKQQNAYFLTFSANCWLGVRLELAGTLIIAFSCICAIAQHGAKAGDSSYAGLAGLSITFALSVTQSLNWSVRMRSDFEANMVAVERVRQYSTLEKEAPQHLSKDSNIIPDWPNNGVIEFKAAKLRYRPGLPLVLKGMSLVIPARTKVGVVGRTGAGKSTIIVGLLRIVELDSGSIFIDGVNIRSLGLNKLRSSIAVIPQDPTLFSGSIRNNLDPFYTYDDQTLCKALQRVGLMSDSTATSTLHGEASGIGPVTSLSDEVLEGGSNFSVGQRQLLVIARALICEAKIVIMDEATASVDSETDAKIQRLMRNDFKHATTITVAHRLNTIMDSDMIIVMDNGRAAEFGSPKALLKKSSGMFKSLVDTFEQEKGHT